MTLASSGFMKNYVSNLLLLCIVLLLSFIAAEITIRSLAEVDVDGQWMIFKKPLYPYMLPVQSLEKDIKQYNETSYIMMDSLLGWTIRPNAAGSRGQSNSKGLRGEEINENATVTIALFGDSFVHGDDVFYNETWASFLREKIPNSEVLNFGVGGYGLDQSYLRWKNEGQYYYPDIVLIGFQPENCLRNLNIIRDFYFRHNGIPFSKPRFIVNNSNLELVNSPTIPIGEISTVVSHAKNNSLMRYEYFYDPSDYKPNVAFNSKFIAAFYSYYRFRLEREFELNRFFTTEDATLCSTLLQQFVREAQNTSEVFIVHLPTKEHLNYGNTYAHIWKSVQDKVIDPSSVLQNYPISEIYINHFTPLGNEIVAQVILEELNEKSVVLKSIS